MRSLLLSAAACALFLLGCSPNAITEGSHELLPPPGGRVLVWGGHPSASRMAEQWLNKRGVLTIDPAKARQVAGDGQIALRGSEADEKVIREVAKLVRAEFVLIVETPFTQGEPGAPYVGPYGGGTIERVEYIASVRVKGLRVDTGEIAWRGSAHYPGRYDDLASGLEELTCQALATAWGLRPAGHYPISAKQMCEFPGPGASFPR